MRTLAIETSCDDTSLALVAYADGNFVVEKLLSFSQINIHQPYGGVVPELAYRSHADKIIRLLEEFGGNTLKEQIDFISVTTHPWLPGALIVGITTGHMLGKMRKKPVVEVNHIMGHVFSILPDRHLEILKTPYICMTVSGGHNDIYLVEEWSVDWKQWEEYTITRHKRNHIAIWESIWVGGYKVKKIGQTLDDAAGEAFDKVARMLGGPNPGGPWIDELAKKGKADDRVHLSATFLSADEFNFSFSWLKSQVHYLLQKFKDQWIELDDQLKANIAFVFQEEIAHVLAKKLIQAAEYHQAKTIWLAGGVSANNRVRERVSEVLVKNYQTPIPWWTPAKMVYCTDNAAMIGATGLVMWKS